ncbi:hypothetical protein AAHE18_16G145500 [Arachis hypogaea]|nr:uncharacterized protein DS421_16g545540 [Arachis hypogaea]
MCTLIINMCPLGDAASAVHHLLKYKDFSMVASCLTKTPTLLIHLGRLAAVAHGAHVGVAPTSRVTILADLPLRSAVSVLCSPCRPFFLRRRLSGDWFKS